MQYFHIRFNMRAFPAWQFDEGLQNKVVYIQKAGEENTASASWLNSTLVIQTSRSFLFPSLNHNYAWSAHEWEKKKITNSLAPPVQVTPVVAASKA